MTEPDWLDEQEMRIWRAFLEAGGRMTALLDASIKAESGLSFDDYEVLVHLSEAPGQRMRMSDLAGSVVHSQSRLTQRVDRLQKQGLVCREKCPSDKRGTFAVLTDAGMDVVHTVVPSHVADVRRWLIDQIKPEERATMADVLERVALLTRAAQA